MRTLYFIILFLLMYAESNSQWEFCRIELNHGPNLDFAVNCNNIFTCSKEGVFRSTDYGNNWTPTFDGIEYNFVLSLFISDSNVFAGNNFGRIYHSTDNGNSWSEKQLGSSLIKIFSILVQGDTVFAGTSMGLYISIDKGNNWFKKNTGSKKEWINTIASYGNNIYIGTQSGVYLSTDRGINWIPKCSGLLEESIFSFAFSGDSIYAGSISGLYFSSDNGNKWTIKETGFYINNVTSILIVGNYIFAGSYEGVFLSANNGETWIRKSDGLYDFRVLSMEICGNEIFAGTDGVVLMANLYDFGITSVKEHSSFFLDSSIRISPNPASYYIDISFDNLILEEVKDLKIYNSLGECVISNELQITKNRNVRFDISTLPTGAYYFVLNIGKEMLSKSIIVVR